VEERTGYYATTAIADHAVKCLKEHGAEHAGEPFFSFVAFTAPHFPLQAPKEDIVKYRERYAAGWDRLRDERWERMKAAGVGGGVLSAFERGQGPPYAFPEAIEKLGPDEVNRPVAWEGLTGSQRAFQAAKMSVHAAMIDRMDREIGRILGELEKMGVVENTLVMFLSDNGASAEMMVRGDGHRLDAECGTGATFLSLGPGWSTMANTPFRKHKTWVHEGGISTPMIVRWPAVVKDRGALRTTPGHVIDIVPTVLAAAEVTAPAEWNGAPVPAAPGKSLLSVLSGTGTVERESLWWLHEGNRAIRVGDWKLVSAGKGGAWELYDLGKDRAETKDLAGEMPEKVKELAARWEAQTEAYGALVRREAK
jgi:arylsulfatase